MAIAANFPSIKPSLSLDFANVGRLDPRVTFARASTARYYDGVTTAKAEQNLLIESQNFGNFFWTSAAVNISVTANTEVAPDGTTTAETLTDNATSGSHRLITSGASNPAIPGSTTFALSVFLKKGTHNYAYIGFRDAGTSDRYIAAAFDLDLGTAGDTFNPGSGTLVGSTITSVGNGWYRCSVVGALSGTTNSNPTVVIGMATAATGISLGGFLSESYVGTGTTLYIWGAQLEQRSAVTAYTATTTQPITNYIPVLLTAQNGVPRFDHNPTTGVALGLEIEEQRTNLLTYSAEFNNAAWAKTNATFTADTIVAPDGTLTGDKMIASSTSGTHTITQGTVTSGTTYVFSVYAKAGEYSQLQLSGMGTEGQGFNTVYNLATQTVTSAPTGSSITSVGNGWYRCVLIITASATGGPIIRIRDDSGNNNFAGNDFNGIYIWGAQIEAGAFPTSYIATTTTALTRSADAASMTGTNFSEWYNQSEGTLYVESSTFNPSSVFSRIASIENSSYSSSIQTARNLTDSRGFGDGVSINQGSGTFPVNTFVKQALAAKVNDFALSTNGSAVAVDTSTNPMLSNVIALGIGASTQPTAFFNGTINKISYYPVRLSNAQLQALTG